MSTEEIVHRGRMAAAARGAGKDAQWYVIIAGIVADSLNRRYGLGLEPQEIIAIGAGLIVAAGRLRTWLDSTD